MDEVKFEGKWERSEYIRAIRKGNRPSWPDALIVIAMVIFGSLAHQSLVIYTIAGIVLVAVVNLIILPRTLWSRSIGIEETRQSTFSDSGILTSSTSQTVNLAWSRIRQVRESPDYYFLRLVKYPVPIPIRKSSFNSLDDEACFRSILGRNTNASLKLNPQLDKSPS